MNGSNIELRSNGESGLTLEGYASTFRVWYPIGVGVEERMRFGAFKRSLAEGPAVALRVEHSALPLAHTKGGSLQLSEDGTGLLTVASLNPRDPDVQSLRAKAENSPLQMSFAFRCNKDSWNEDRSRREVVEAGLHKGDVSIVCYGANEATSLSIDARAGASSLEERRAFGERIRGYTGGPKWGFTLAAEAEEPRGHATIAVPVLIHSYVETAKAKRAKLRRGRVDAKPTPASAARSRTGDKAGRYSVEQARRAKAGSGRKPVTRALGDLVLSPFGKDWEINSGRDVYRAVLAVEVGHAAGSNEDAIKAWIFKRAEDLGVSGTVPAGWKGDWKGNGTRATVRRR
jgi:HK97 family phage prohead protease